MKKEKSIHPDKPYNSLPTLPPEDFIETDPILRQLINSHKALAELKGYAELLPNKSIVLSSITVKEAKDSSEIENIITTHDELFRSLVMKEKYIKPEVKEVLNYKKALFKGFELLKKHKLLTVNMIVQIQQEIEQNSAGIRKLPGTKLVSDSTGEVLYTPPDNPQVIINLLKNLEEFINTDSDRFDPLTKLAIVHYQFEAIHPFYDANGRTGRILNVLYLVLKGLLNEPFLYLSGYIIKHKPEYYRLLRNVTFNGDWENWVLFILKVIEITAKETLSLSKEIVNAMESVAEQIKTKRPKIYSHDLVELIFSNVYTKISMLEEKKIASRNIASKYLKELSSIGVLKEIKVGKEKFFVNEMLFKILKKS